jgi:hypothetical protein
VNAALIRKELRGQWPFLFLGLALLVIDVLELLSEQWDLKRLSSTFYEFNSFFFIFQFFISFAVGSGLLIREIDDGTLAFLDGLPLTRARAFTTKIVTATAVLLCYPLGHLVLLSVLHLTARESLDYDLHVSLIAATIAPIVLMTAVGLTCGLLLGFLRSLAWMVLALLAIALKLLSSAWPRFSALNPVDALMTNLVGAHLKLPIESITAQCCIVLLSGLSAFWFFRDAGADRRRLQLVLSRPLISATVTIATIATLFGAIFLYEKSHGEEGARQATASSPSTAQFKPAAPGHSQTSHYTFSYPARQAEPVQLLLLHADEVFSNVAVQLNIDGGSAIDVDLSGSEANTEGTAFFDRIRMFPGGEAPLSVLAHETTHVFASRLAGGKNERELTKMQAFNEGLAHWVEQTLEAKTGVSDLDKLQAAIVSHRHMASARQLSDMDALARDVDRNLVYPLGAVVVDALIRRYGADAPKTVLLTLGRADFPRDLEGYSLWQAAFQLSGFDLTLVFDDYARLLKEWELKSTALIADLPRPRGSLVRSDDFVGVAVRLDAALPAGSRAVVRFRPRSDSPLRDYVTRSTKDDVAWQPINSIANEKVCFQPGISTKGIVIYEIWSCLPLDSAAKETDD